METSTSSLPSPLKSAQTTEDTGTGNETGVCGSKVKDFLFQRRTETWLGWGPMATMSVDLSELKSPKADTTPEKESRPTCQGWNPERKEYREGLSHDTSATNNHTNIPTV
jgi:hypothetical protein